MDLHPYPFCLSFYLLHFVLPQFEDNGLLFWVPDVLCQHSEAVLWNLLSVQMFFWWICGGESGLPLLFLCHLRTAHSYIYFLYLNFKPLTTTPKIIWIMNMMNTYMNTYTEVIFVVFLDDTVMVFCFVSVTNFNCISVLYTVKCNDFLLSFLSFAVR